jgi:hypothetical protein
MRAFAALIAGFAAATLLAIGATSLLKRFAPDWAGDEAEMKPGPVFVHLGFSLMSGAAGGYVTAWAAVGNPLPAVLVLGIVLLLLAGLSTLQSRGERPLKYQVALIVLAPLGVVAGGLVRLRVMGLL